MSLALLLTDRSPVSLIRWVPSELDIPPAIPHVAIVNGNANNRLLMPCPPVSAVAPCARRARGGRRSQCSCAASAGRRASFQSSSLASCLASVPASMTTSSIPADLSEIFEMLGRDDIAVSQ